MLGGGINSFAQVSPCLQGELLRQCSFIYGHAETHHLLILINIPPLLTHEIVCTCMHDFDGISHHT